MCVCVCVFLTNCEVAQVQNTKYRSLTTCDSFRYPNRRKNVPGYLSYFHNSPQDSFKLQIIDAFSAINLFSFTTIFLSLARLSLAKTEAPLLLKLFNFFIQPSRFSLPQTPISFHFVYNFVEAFFFHATHVRTTSNIVVLSI